MNVVDSSAWLEYFIDSEKASLFAPAIEDTDSLIVPVVVLYKVFKKVLRIRGENEALQVAAIMQDSMIVDLDSLLALEAAKHQLPFAESIIYATTLRYKATLWTQDAHFQHLPEVNYFPA
ncbi:type II toxin-antitoxin system VapC family toxin [Phragmitibacter flavus]|uniref:Type II toxin-antitoxin system VapC family toxin n=1 Tax=Phragmitibacter flavus TaxID=2576071 RepID=A0A5R8KDQ8_9BACT|nr:type II toxin-antitoxin system VapC family toxin [Phragmitibacter flavus]TLD70387.1 type II toxin-antitoxin system VapC family toxin [Phragmitibacter flavus]